MKLSAEIRSPELTALCDQVRVLAACEKYDECEPLICEAMGRYPNAPQPHNLLGVILEKVGDHASAMKHFRAAWALDPTYRPANQNLTTYGTFFSGGGVAFDECDCRPSEDYVPCRIEYDERGVGHMVRGK